MSTQPSQDPNSGLNPAALYVLFEGPWIFTNPDESSEGQVLVTTLGSPHICTAGIWNTPTNTTINPDGRSSKPISVQSGSTWTGTIPGFKSTASLGTLLDASHASNKFAYLKHTRLTVVPQTHDRSISLPVPTRILFAGRMTNITLRDTSGTLQAPGSAAPFLTTIFEYVQGTDPLSLTLSSSTGETYGVTSPQHLVFRLFHHTMKEMDKDEEIRHAEEAFADLVAHLQLDGKPLGLSLKIHKILFAIGSDVSRMQAAELGIDSSETEGGEHEPHIIDVPSCGAGALHVVRS